MINQIKFFNNIDTSTKVGVFGLSRGLISLYIDSVFKTVNSNVLVVVNDSNEINELYNDLIVYEKQILTFPMDSYALSQAEAVSPEFMQERFDTLIKLGRNEKFIIITSLEGVTHPILNKETYYENIINLSVGDELNQNFIEQFLTNNMYERVYVVTQTGEYAYRGHVLDIFPEDYQNPIRIEFWGDEVESIREFEIDTQRTINKIEKIKLYPNPDCQLTDNSATIIDYVDGFNIIVDFSQIERRFLDYHPKNHIFNSELFNHFINELDTDINLDLKKVYYKSSIINSFNSNVNLLNNFIKYKFENNYLLVICLDFKQQIDLIVHSLEFKYKVINSIEEFDYTMVNIIIKHQYSSIDFDDAKICILNSQIIFNKSAITKKYLNKFKFTQKIKHSDELVIGDYIVHETHGIGRYDGIKTISTKAQNENILKDFFEILYKDNDKLYVPIEQIALIQKYSSNSDYKPKLNKLGGVEWEKTKRKISGRMEEIALKLLNIYATREKSLGFACSEDSVEQLIFDAEFEFEETKDQMSAILDIKNDMESATPMDRLLCGDVGFGKTEVAFRAAYKSMDNSKQVAYLCPTTILSIQQYENAVNRFVNVPINIALLNRYTTQKERTQILENLSNGRIDFIIGTHSILSEKIVFKDLGLLIVDEEQRFGVEHKEKIKEIKAGVDVLTLSATPIPRTLQMSLLGIRSLSIIDTAPVNRFPVQTYVIAYSEQIIKEAVIKELSRNGQVFILNNRISMQNSMKRMVNKLVINARVDIANGKMNKDELEEVFHRFNTNEFDVLISTTIIETGINIPNANTLIIIDSDKFGLAQLYQIRGRVGRSNNVAYAYLMYNPDKILTENAKKRLEVIKNFTSLGSGFKIASRDLSIRGAGDILGAEQAGFIDTIGVELYMKMLKDVINNKIEPNDKPSTSRLPLTTYSNHIPSSYVNDDDIKLNIHKKIQTITNEKSYIEIENEISDIYGKIPVEVEQYMKQVLFDIKIKEFGILKIDDNEKAVKVLINSIEIDGVKMLNAINHVGRHVRLTNRQDIVYFIIDKTKTSNWKDDLLKFIDYYNKF